jgi:hypothetical protein
MRFGAPAVGQRADHEQTAPSLAICRRVGRYDGELPALGVGDRDAEEAGRGVEGEGEPEVAALDAAVQGRVGCEFKESRALLERLRGEL